MRWSKLRKLVEERCVPSLCGRIAIHSAAYGGCSCGHCWITLDKKVIANFCTRAYYNKNAYKLDALNTAWNSQLVTYGEKSRQGAYSSMFQFIHSLSIEQALSSQDVLVQALAVIDSRVGNRRLADITAETLHPLAQKLLAIRRAAELPS